MIEARRIIHVPRRFVLDEWGGTETVLAELVAQQRVQGWQPEIRTSRALSHTSAETWHGVPIRRFRYCYPFFGLTPTQRLQLDKKGGNLLSLPLFFSLLREKGVRLFHAHSLKRLGGTVLTAARRQKKPFVVTLHGGVYDVPKQDREEMVSGHAGTFEWGKIFGIVFQSRRLLEEADAVICVGRGEFENARASLKHDRVYHLGNGVDAARFASGNGAAFRRQHQIPADALLLASYCRIDPQKDQLTLIEAFDRLAAEHPKLHLVFAGPCTSADYGALLGRRIAASPHASRIRRLGAIASDGSALPDAYHACDIFVLPSRHEPFGIVVLEAWCAGRPVVVSHVGGLRNLVEHEENGLFFSSGDSAALSEQLEKVIRCGELRSQLASAGRQLAHERYSWKKIAEETECIYQAAEARTRRLSRR